LGDDAERLLPRQLVGLGGDNREFRGQREFVPTSQVLFGSDFPYVTPAVLQAEKYGLETSKVLDDADRAAIDRDNALALFPRFAIRPGEFADMAS
jgi:Amidohydrolase